MGTCWNCGKQITLGEEQTTCDSCRTILFYRCNNCKEEFKIVDKETNEKLQECKLCGYFICPHCNICSYQCVKYKWEKEILKILAPEINSKNNPTLLVKVRRILEYIESEKISKKRKECDNHIPITYAKNRIKSLLAKERGFRVKNKSDMEAFVKRIDNLSNLSIGTKTTINNIKEDGRNGQEERDAFNLLVCLGKMKLSWLKNIDGEEYCLYERVDNKRCKFLNVDNLIINECPNCKTRYERGIEYCSKCSPYKKGKHIGEQHKTKERLNNIDTCQKYRGEFGGKYN